MKVVILLVAVLAITNSVSSSRIRLSDFPDIERIQSGQSVSDDQSLSILSHLSQSHALAPARRSFTKRAGLALPLPLEPTPRPLPLEILRDVEPQEDFVDYIPRPERKQPQIVPIPTYDLKDEFALEPIRRKPTNRGTGTSDNSQRPQRPSVFSEDDTLYRSPEVPNESQSVEAPIDPPAYSQPELVFEGDVPVYQDDFISNERIRASAGKPVRPIRRRPQYSNRPRVSAEVQAVRKPVAVRPARRPVGQQQYVRSQEEFDFPKTVQEVRAPTREEQIVRQEVVQRPVLQKSPVSFSTSSAGYPRRKPTPVQRNVEKAPIKQLKKKKVNPYKVAPLLKGIKKDKRAIVGGSHLDQNGIEFVEEARKIEGAKLPNNRIAFQIHGAQGPNSYRFGYDTGKGYDRQFRYEERDNYGEVKGRYGYYDNYGKLRVVNYSAHPKYGFSADVPH